MTFSGFDGRLKKNVRHHRAIHRHAGHHHRAVRRHHRGVHCNAAPKVHHHRRGKQEVRCSAGPKARSGTRERRSFEERHSPKRGRIRNHLGIRTRGLALAGSKAERGQADEIDSCRHTAMAHRSGWRRTATGPLESLLLRAVTFRS